MAPIVRLATKRAAEINGKRRRQNVGRHENQDLRAPAVVRIGNLERVKGIEPSYSAWKSKNFPTNIIAVLTSYSPVGD